MTARKATQATVSQTPAEKPPFLVVENTLKCQTSEGEISLPLAFKTKLLRRFGQLEEMDAFFLIVDEVAGPEVSAVIDELDIMETTGIMVKFFSVFQERVQATMGELQGSSK
jgi:hypothetical protein